MVWHDGGLATMQATLKQLDDKYLKPHKGLDFLRFLKMWIESLNAYPLTYLLLTVIGPV